VRVAITGASGFVGRWLNEELRAAGHEPIAPEPAFDIRRTDDIRSWLQSTTPDAIAHLAAVSFGPDARARPDEAFDINVGGTIGLLEVARAMQSPPVVLIAGSSEVYGTPSPSDLPLRETATLAPNGPYGLSKAAQEAVGLAWAQRHDLRLVATRSFNHIGPGQRPDFVVPALTGRLLALRAGTADRVRVGNIHVRRDLTDVRDVVRAYRLLLEGQMESRLGRTGSVYNVGSGVSVEIGDVLARLAALVGVEPVVEVDPDLVRATDAPEIRADTSAIEAAIGWRPAIPLDRTLSDIVEAAVSAARS
jgi:GDP-4-dehydro-6-deoxy-D-mannose reductase